MTLKNRHGKFITLLKITYCYHNDHPLQSIRVLKFNAYMAEISECGVRLECELFEVSRPVPTVVFDGFLFQ